MVRRLADQIGLRDWTVELLHEPPAEPWAMATCEPLRGRKYALIRLSNDFHKLSAVQQRSALIHELVHLHVASACDVIRCELPEHLAPAVFDLLWATFNRQMEYAVDGLTGVIAPFIDSAASGG